MSYLEQVVVISAQMKKEKDKYLMSAKLPIDTIRYESSVTRYAKYLATIA